MTIEAISAIFQLGLPVGLIVVGVAFGIIEVWPYWKSRDTENRQREYDREMAQIASQNVQSEALVSLANAVKTCPLK